MERYKIIDVILGLDIAKDKHVAFMGTARGKTLRRRVICKNDISGFNNLLEEPIAVQKQHGLNKMGRDQVCS